MADDSATITLLKQHFKEDDKNFSEIKAKQSKYEELLTINGEHMSHIRKDLSEVKSILLEQNRVQKQESDKLNKHIEEVAPILKNYQDGEATKRTLERYRKPVVNGVIGLGALIGAWYVIRDFISK